MNTDLKPNVTDRKYCLSVMSFSGKDDGDGDRLQGHHVGRGARTRW